MSVRPPRILARQTAPNPLETLEHEVLQEKMAALSRLGRRLERALQRFAECEAAADGNYHGQAVGDREALLAEAGEALWYFVIQREAMGLRDTERVLRTYRVPPAVRARMGVVPRLRSARSS